MRAWSLALLLTAVCLGGCSPTMTRYADPLDKPVLPLLPGAVERAAEVESAAQEEDSVDGAVTVSPALRSYVILLADDEGAVGQVEVEAGGERVLLDQANQGVDFADLSQTFEAGAAEMEVFDRALAAEPPSTVLFVVFFDPNKAEPPPAEVLRVRGILDPVRSWAAPEVLIVGHADRRGSEPLNLELSQRRAAAISRLLAQEGIEPVALDVRALGESRPSVDTADGVAEARNRRVVVRIR